MNVGFFPLLFILFLGLKLAGILAWSWFWITAPLWAGFGLFLAFFSGVLALKIFSRK